MFRQMLMGGASRAVLSPETDDGGFDDGPYDETIDDADADLDGEGDGDADGGTEDRLQDDDDGADDGEEDGPAEVATRSSRGENRIAAATRIAAEAKSRAEGLERELQAIRSQGDQRAQTERQQQEQERLAMMDPGERAEYIARNTAQNLERQLQQIRFESADASDKAAFEALASRNPAAAKVKDRVENYLKEMRAQGTTAPRETVLKYVLGELALNRAPKAKAAGQRASAAGKERQQVRASSGRGDVAPSGGRGKSEAAQRRARLEDVQI